MSWTQDDIDTLTRLVATGLSSGQIVKHLEGTYTRNAVIGKAYRLGLQRSPEAARQLKTAGGRKAVALQRAIAGIKRTRARARHGRQRRFPMQSPCPRRQRPTLRGSRRSWTCNRITAAGSAATPNNQAGAIAARARSTACPTASNTPAGPISSRKRSSAYPITRRQPPRSGA